MQFIDYIVESQQMYYTLNTALTINALNSKLTIDASAQGFSNINLTENSNEILIWLKKFADIDVIWKMKLTKNNVFSFKMSFLGIREIKAKNIIEKTSLIRYFLAISQKYNNAIFKISVKSGSIVLQTCPIFLNKTSIKQSQSQECLLEIIRNIIKNVCDQIKFILYCVNIQTDQNAVNKNKYTSNDLKSFIMVSPYYAWSMLKPQTKSKRQKLKNNYQDMRKGFLLSREEQKIKKLILDMDSVFIKGDQKIVSFISPSIEIESQFKNSYLKKFGEAPRAKLLNQISLAQQFFDELLEKKQISVKYEKGKLHLALQWCEELKVKHQKEILSKFKNQQQMGLPKYYFIKNIKVELENFIITNLTNVLTFKKYLNQNAQSISLITKLHLLHQITLALKSCRDSNIVHHNLVPQNLFVRKGLFVKLSDFSNAFHNQYKEDSNIKISTQSFLPYVSNYDSKINLLYCDEKADTYSMGNIIYQTIYGKTPFHMKYGCDYPDTNQWFPKLLKPQLIAVQKTKIYSDDVFRFLCYLSLQATIHNKILSNSNLGQINIDDIFTIDIKSRPYLDWMLVIIRSILENEKRKFL